MGIYSDRQPKDAGGRRAGSLGKRALAVRAMAGETAWLDGKLLWHEGRVAWESARGPFCPTPGDISLAQRRLNQIARYPVAGKRAFGNLSEWLARRSTRLELAKRLQAIPACDLVALAERPARSLSPSEVAHLARVLLAEASLHIDLPALPSRMLAACGERAEAPLTALLQDPAAPTQARALAALTLGAIHRRNAHADGRRLSKKALGEPWVQRAYAWGLGHGLPDAPEPPVLYVGLLLASDGTVHAERYLETRLHPGHFQIPTGTIHDLLREGVPPETAVAMAEAVGEAEPLVERVSEYRSRLPEEPPRKRREMAAKLQAESREMVRVLREALHEYVLSTLDPIAACLVARHANFLLDQHRQTGRVFEYIKALLESGLSLPAELRLPYLQVLDEYRAVVWDRSCLPPETHILDWLTHCQSEHIEGIKGLLSRSGSPDVIREALELGVYWGLSQQDWTGPERYHILLSLIREHKLAGNNHFAEELGYLLDELPSPLAPALRSKVDALIRLALSVGRTGEQSSSATGHEHEAEDERAHLLNVARYVLSNHISERTYVEVLGKVLRYLPRIYASMHNPSEPVNGCACSEVRRVALMIDQAHSGSGEIELWVDWLLRYLADQARKDDKFYVSDCIEFHLADWAELALILGGTNFHAFQSIMRTVLDSRLDYETGLRGGVEALRDFPILHPALAYMFPRQPRRCVNLLVQVGYVKRLGKEALSSLTTPPEEMEELPDGWQPLAEIAPNLVPLVREYLSARRTVRGSEEVPPGVRKAMEQPRKWATELAYIERALAEQPERADLAARASNLRARLADEGGILSSVQEELAESLKNIAGEALVAAAKYRLRACYYTRLEKLTGRPLPEDLALNNDLANAVLLATEIDWNRKVLLRLLRAYIAGDHRWPDQHPSNIAFLKSLEDRGVDTAAWLGEHPRTCRFPGAAGGRVRLVLERDPLRVLQMGNYFDTCLGVNGMNAFSTVANACELSKRVIYAYDGLGRVVGRKLVAISREGALIGFRTYSTFGPDEGWKKLGQIFASYAADFARKCGLPLADSGTAQSLFVRHWYDDGVIPWGSSESPPEPTRSASPYVSSR